MIREGRMFGFALGLLATALLALPLRAIAGDKPREPANTTAAPLEIPHTTDLELDARGNKKRAPATSRSPSSSNPRRACRRCPSRRTATCARASSPPKCAARRWWAGSPTNLYRDKGEKGWCLEADPGQGEYVVFYRLALQIMGTLPVS